MDLDAELRTELAAFAKAGQHICAAEVRIRKQQELAEKLGMKGRETRDAERLVDVLQRTLLQWEVHRRLIEERISYLETRRTALDDGKGA